MRSDRILSLAFFWAACAWPADFTLKTMLKPTTKQTSTQSIVQIDILVSGIPPDVAALTKTANWTVTAKGAKEPAARPITLKEVQWTPGLGVALIISASELAGADAAQLTWKAQFNGQPQAQLSFQPKAAPAPGTATKNATKKKTFAELFAQSKGKSDADLYLFGSFLAGVGTKPLYTIDAKGNWALKNTGNWQLGIASALSTNASSQTPVDRTRVDPDSITGGFTAEYDWRSQTGRAACQRQIPGGRDRSDLSAAFRSVRAVHAKQRSGRHGPGKDTAETHFLERQDEFPQPLPDRRI